MSDYISWENHFDHVDSATVVVWLRYPSVYVCWAVEMITRYESERIEKCVRQRQRTFDMIKPATNLSEAKRLGFLYLFLVILFYYAFKSLNISTISYSGTTLWAHQRLLWIFSRKNGAIVAIKSRIYWT